jgi:hypothetical protein
MKVALSWQFLGISFRETFMSKLVSLLLLALLLTGCTSSPYLHDRQDDAGDIFTISLGYGAGAKARVGTVNVGLLVNGDQIGYSKGFCFTPTDGLARLGMMDATATFISCETFGYDWYEKPKLRGKYYEAYGLVALTKGDVWGRDHPPWNAYVPYYTEIEAVAGLGGSLRLGFNPGELLDFIVGWVGLDLFDDDLAKKKTQAATTETPKTSTP